MGWTKRHIAQGGLALACAVACGDVEESITTSGTIGEPSTTSSGGTLTDPTAVSTADNGETESVSADGTTQGSASAEDATTDPVDPTDVGTTGVGDVDTGGHSTTSTTASDPTTDDGAGVTTEPASACDPAADDTACDTCVKTSCCEAVEACSTNVDCWCVATCVGNGGDAFGCGDACGVDAAPPGSYELVACAGLVCSVQCPQI